jgi:membrane protein YdbS with pleckstrin-like domain
VGIGEILVLILLLAIAFAVFGFFMRVTKAVISIGITLFLLFLGLYFIFGITPLALLRQIVQLFQR